ncbi:hypothetical protein IIC65_07415, partial [Candidatus Sumerlaeota bacterium]|nr:hypothetical protein [Candidatus Sumerlaeota bacterium]
MAKSPASKSKKLRTPLLPHLEGIDPYPPGKPIEEVQREYGLKEVIKLASNENPIGPSPRALKAMEKTSAEMNFYPDGGAYVLKRKLAAMLNGFVSEFLCL